jgi:hypothetical protein
MYRLINLVDSILRSLVLHGDILDIAMAESCKACIHGSSRADLLGADTPQYVTSASSKTFTATYGLEKTCLQISLPHVCNVFHDGHA